jgi:biotin carboxylase
MREASSSSPRDIARATIRVIEHKSTRYCARYHPSPVPISLEKPGQVAAAINAAVAAQGLSMVIPGDTEATRVLTTIQASIHAPCFPMPTAATFERLANKWTFHQLCGVLGVPSPASQLVVHRADLADALKSHGPDGWIAKPVDREGGNGFFKLTAETVCRQLEQIDYEPILLQEFIPGRDISISLFCHEGEPWAVATYEHYAHSIHFRRHPELERYASQVAARARYSGILCFDARLTPGGEVSLIECNPRFWNNVDAAMVCGLNFVELGLSGERPAERLRIEEGTRFRNLRNLRQEFSGLDDVSRQDVKVILHWLKDYPFWLRRLSRRAPDSKRSA